MFTNSQGYSFQGQEHDDEVKGKGNSIGYEARMYDPRVGRWLSRDPLEHKYVSLSPYHFAGNSVIRFVDIGGERIIDSNGKRVKLTFTKKDDGSIEITFGDSDLTEMEKSNLRILASTELGLKMVKRMNRSLKKIYPKVDESTLQVTSLPAVVENAKGYDKLAADAVEEGEISERDLKNKNYIIAKQGRNRRSEELAVVNVKAVESEDNPSIATEEGVLLENYKNTLTPSQIDKLKNGTLEISKSPFSEKHTVNTMPERISITSFHEIYEFYHPLKSERKSREMEKTLSEQLIEVRKNEEAQDEEIQNDATPK